MKGHATKTIYSAQKRSTRRGTRLETGKTPSSTRDQAALLIFFSYGSCRMSVANLTLAILNTFRNNDFITFNDFILLLA